MPIFGDPSSPYDEPVEKATAETMTGENWTLMFDICDRVTTEGPRACKQCLLSVRKRLNHRDPHVVLLALSLLDCLWNNCGSHFRREVSSKDFVGELNYKCTNSNRVVAERARSLVKKWAENECTKDGSLSLIESLYRDIRDQGLSFEPDPATQKKKAVVSNDPNVVSSEQEEADIAKAIALSLQEGGKQQQLPQQNCYPSLANTTLSQNGLHAAAQNKSQGNKVKALYDFEAVEDNELSFLAGELIIVHDDRIGGAAQRSGAVERADFSPLRNGPETSETETAFGPPKVQIDENVLMKCIELLESCDPAADPSDDPTELPFLEQMSKAQAPLIDQKLVKIDKQLNMLAEVDIAIREVLTAYDTAVQQVAMPSVSAVGPLPPAGIPPFVSYTAPSVPPTPVPSSAASISSPSYPPHWAMNGQWQQQNQ
uniref:VHS domain-containing protein n=1 Tax=Globodera pallida TaxID=36090 RepID=A0A183BQ84_GLOPA